MAHAVCCIIAGKFACFMFEHILMRAAHSPDTVGVTSEPAASPAIDGFTKYLQYGEDQVRNQSLTLSSGVQPGP